MQKQKVDEELKDCTFTPQTNSRLEALKKDEKKRIMEAENKDFNTLMAMNREQ